MTTTLIGEGSYGEIYHPGLSFCSELPSEAKHWVSKVMPLTDAAENEIEIGQMLKKAFPQDIRDHFAGKALTFEFCFCCAVVVVNVDVLFLLCCRCRCRCR